MIDKVKRYAFKYQDGNQGSFEDKNGNYVQHSDYMQLLDALVKSEDRAEKLQHDNSDVQKELEDTTDAMGNVQAQLRADLAARDALLRRTLDWIGPEHPYWDPQGGTLETLHAEIKAATESAPPLPSQPQVTAVTKEMVDRFLAWPLPKDFSPDCHVSFNWKPNALNPDPTWPVGTNLFSAEQAREMLEHAIGVPQPQVSEAGDK